MAVSLRVERVRTGGGGGGGGVPAVGAELVSITLQTSENSLSNVMMCTDFKCGIQSKPVLWLGAEMSKGLVASLWHY